MAGIKMISADDWCVFYQKYCLDISDPEFLFCIKCGFTCSSCPQRMEAVRF